MSVDAQVIESESDTELVGAELAEAELVDEVLVEEVSIDGMCGVY